MTRRRLLMTVDTVGGVWQYTTELTAALDKLGYDVVLAVLGPDPSPAQRKQVGRAQLIETRLPLDWMSPSRAAVVRTADAIAALAKSLDVDLVQLNQPALAVADFAMPVVAVAHSCVGTWWQAAGTGPEPAGFAWQTDLMRDGLRRADRVVCPSRSFAAAVAARYDLVERPATVHNGRTPPAANAMVRPLVRHDGTFTAGRLWDPGKNVVTLDRAAAMLAVPFTAAGPLAGPHGETISFNHLNTLGKVDDAAIEACLAAQPVFASAARYEPFGLAVLEAAQAGCPLVLADIATFRELWDGAAAFVDPDDALGFAKSVKNLLNGHELRQARSEAARRRAERYTPARMAEGMAAIYASLTLRAARSVAA